MIGIFFGSNLVTCCVNKQILCQNILLVLKNFFLIFDVAEKTKIQWLDADIYVLNVKEEVFWTTPVNAIGAAPKNLSNKQTHYKPKKKNWKNGLPKCMVLTAVVI